MHSERLSDRGTMAHERAKAKYEVRTRHTEQQVRNNPRRVKARAEKVAESQGRSYKASAEIHELLLLRLSVLP